MKQRQQIQVRIKPQFVATSEKKQFRGFDLHGFQDTMLNIENVEEEVLILPAPTGTGKSFSFPLPIIKHKDEKMLGRKRALILSPTNALIEDMNRAYEDLAKEENLKITILNSKVLNEIEGATYTQRWVEILKIIYNHDIIITNPDLLNWAMTGGYSYEKWQEQVVELIEMVHYFIFDEYHIYDEEQTGNIIGWMLFSKMMLKRRFKTKKFVFASATPEPALVVLLKKYDFSVRIEEEIIIEKPTSEKDRKIKGEIELCFLKINSKIGETRPDDGVVNYLLKESDFKQQLDSTRALVIYDELKSLRLSKKAIKAHFAPFEIAEVSGYTTKMQEKEDVEKADLILGTNKVEVGVNLKDVHLILMPAGKHLRNFVQRLGRIARKGKDGKAYIFVDKFKTYGKTFKNGQTLSYYELIELLEGKKIMADRKFYEEVIPRFVGAFFYVMLFKTLKVHSFKEMLRASLKENPLEGEALFVFNKLQAIHLDVQSLKTIDRVSGYKKQRIQIEDWWKNFLMTFSYFRGDSKTIKIIDLDEDSKRTAYSKEWSLKHRKVVKKVETEDEIIYEVSGYREEKAELQYMVETFPFGDMNEGNRVLTEKDKWNLPHVFDSKVKEAGIKWSSNNDFSKKVRQILANFKYLRPIFTQKRLKISDITVASIFF